MVIKIIVLTGWCVTTIAFLVGLIFSRKAIKKINEIYPRAVRTARTLKSKKIQVFSSPFKIIDEKDKKCIQWSRNSFRAYIIATLSALVVFLTVVLLGEKIILNYIEIIMAGVLIIFGNMGFALARGIHESIKNIVLRMEEIEKLDKRLIEPYVLAVGEDFNSFLSVSGL